MIIDRIIENTDGFTNKILLKGDVDMAKKILSVTRLHSRLKNK